tara:strand:- start:102 stop:314 length:213 start_codon:yes stop_codon:yes gene_type:complete
MATKELYIFTLREIWESVYEVDPEQLENPKSEQEAVQAFCDLIVHNDEPHRSQQNNWEIERVEVRDVEDN